MYITSDFDIKNTPKTPEYSQLENWAVLPDQWPIELEGVIENSGTKTADVFYIYPTLFTNKKNPQWNADIYNNEIKYILLGVDIEFSQIYKVIETGLNDTQTTIAIVDFEVNLPLEESLFVFDKEKYKDYYMNILD